MTIGESIRKARNNMGLTQSELARRIGLAAITIRQYENGSREPRLNTIKQIAAVLNVQPEYFLPVLRGEDEKMKPFDKKTSGSIGLWWDPNSQYFTSGSINLSVLKAFKGNVKIIVKKNRYYSKESNRPNRLAFIVDCKSDKAKLVTVEDIESKDIPVYTKDQVRRIIDGAFEAFKYGISDPLDVLPEDFTSPYYVSESMLEDDDE